MKLESMQLPPSDRHNQTLLKKVRPLFLQTPRFVAAPCLVPSRHIKLLRLKRQLSSGGNRVQRKYPCNLPSTAAARKINCDTQKESAHTPS